VNDQPPATEQTQTVENGCIVIRTSWEDQKRIAAWNWKAIGLLADELAKRREGK
jgi:hypothetical protein